MRILMNASYFPRDILEFLILLFYKHSVRYLIVGDEAAVYYGSARLTGDIDLFLEASNQNVRNLFSALNDFWEGDIPGIDRVDDLLEPGIIAQFGVSPNRINLLNKITEVDPKSACENRKIEKIRAKKGNIEICYIGISDLIINKEAIKRPEDLEYLQYLKASPA